MTTPITPSPPLQFLFEIDIFLSYGPPPLSPRLRHAAKRGGGRGVPLSHVYQILFEIDTTPATMAKYPPSPPAPPYARRHICPWGGMVQNCQIQKKFERGRGLIEIVAKS
jgi:hypothetical protein